MQLSRRGFIGGLLAVVSAPAIVRVESIMPVRFLPASLPGLVPAVDEIIVDVSHQVGNTITCCNLPHGLRLGDVITIGNIRSNHSPERLRQFVVTAQANAGDRLFHIYPAVIPAHPKEYYATTLAPAMRGDKVQLHYPRPPLAASPTHSIE